MGHVTKGFQYCADDQHRQAAGPVHLSRVATQIATELSGTALQPTAQENGPSH